MRRRARRREARPAAVVTAGAVVTLLIVACVFLAEESYNGLPFISYRTVYVSLPSIGHLQLHDPVQIAGVRVGQVLSTTTDNGRALVELQLQGVKPLPTDTKALVRADGLLGARELELVLGHSRQTLPSGATIHEGNGTYYAGVPETLDLFDQKTRGALSETTGNLGEGLIGRGTQLSDAIHVGAPSGADFDIAAQSILAHPEATARLIPNVRSGVGALDAAREDLAEMLAPAATTLRPFITDRGQVDRAIAQAPGTLAQVTAGLAGPAENLLGSLQNLGSSLTRVLPGVPEALRSTTRLLASAPDALRATRYVLDAVPRAVPSALSTLDSLRPNLPLLTQSLTSLKGPVTSLAAHGCDIRQWSEVWRSDLLPGVQPGAGYGPLDGLRVLLISVGASALNGLAKVPAALQDPVTAVYKAPCAYFPGKTFDPDTLSTVVGASIP